MIWTALLNIALWPIVHLSAAWLFTHMPRAWFSADDFLFKPRGWEQDGQIYNKTFAIKWWKSKVPDGAAWFSAGFPKKKLRDRNSEYLQIFVKETCRAESAHWATMLVTPLFFIWNPPWANYVMIGYGVLANLPCIIIQRYNRNVLLKILKRVKGLHVPK